MTGIVLIVHVFVCLALIIIVLLQAGKGADMGAAFGGASKTVFGATGAAGPMAKITVGAAVLFMLTSLYLTWASKHDQGPSVMDRPSPTAPTTPGPVSEPQPGGGRVTIPAPLPGSPADGEGPAAVPLEPMEFEPVAPTPPTGPAPDETPP